VVAGLLRFLQLKTFQRLKRNSDLALSKVTAQVKMEAILSGSKFDSSKLPISKHHEVHMVVCNP
jgi:hypothetical protein